MQPQISGFGLVRGPGTATSDSIPAALSDGEVVIPADKVHNFGAQAIMAMVDKGGLGVKKPPVKEGRVHAAGGGLVDAAAPGLGVVNRVGNSYSGGNVSGPVSINGQPPGGTFSSIGLGATLSTPQPATPTAPAPAAAQPAPFNPALGVGRPNALGSLEDTNAQIASLQGTNGAPGLGLRPAAPPAPALGAVRPITNAASASAPAAQQPQFFVSGGVQAGLQPAAATPPAATAPPAAAPAPAASAAAPPVPYTNRVGGVGPQLAAYRDGGKVVGPGTTTSDSIPAMLSKDEVVMPADTVKAVGADNLLAVIDATHTPTGFGARRNGRAAFADGGIVSEEEIRRQQGAGAVFGVYPRPSSRLSTNANDAALQRGVIATGPQTFEPAPAAQVPPAAAAPVVSGGAGRGSVNPPVAQPVEAAAPALPPAAPIAAAPVATPEPEQSSTLPAGVTRDGNSFSGSNVAGPPATAAPRANALGGMEDTQAQLASLQASNAAVPVGGATIIDNAATEADRRAQFNEGANLGNALARTSWSPRRGVQGDDAAVAAALTPLQLRMRAAADARRSGDETQRALIAERGAEARTKLQERQQGQANGIAQQRLTLEAARLANDGVPSGYRRDASGNLTFIPGGPADPSTPKGKNSLNETQAKALQFGSRMQASEDILGKMAAQGVNQPGLLKRGADAVGAGALANWTQSAEQQQVEQAQRDFINAALRRESGAAIADSEFANARTQYFPQPGDSAEVIAQKKQNRDLATRGILAEVPDSERRITQVRGPQADPAGRPAPAAGTQDDGYTYLGGDPADPKNWRKS